MKIAIIYFSNTGNTQSIAEYLKQYFAVKHQVELYSIQQYKGLLDSYDIVLLGCPALGNEGIEAFYMEPFIEGIPMLGKRIALFGSYGWGNGEWMINWAKRLKGVKKAKVFSEYLMIKGCVEESNLPYINAYIQGLEKWMNREV